MGFDGFLLGSVLFYGFSSFKACSEENVMVSARNRSAKSGILLDFNSALESFPRGP